MFRRLTDARRPALTVLVDGVAAQAQEGDSVAAALPGAGPAGLAAADLCARAGLACMLLDEQASPGGQIYRAVTTSPLVSGSVLGRDYWGGAALARAALASAVHYVPGATVWGLLREGELAVSIGGASGLV